MIEAYEAAVSACDPFAAVADAITVDDDGVTLGNVRFDGASPSDVVVVALGKAASAMVRGAEMRLGSVRGIAASNHTEPCPVPLVVGSHPVPTMASLDVGESLLAFVESITPTDIVLYLISGGGSSIAVAPLHPLTIEDLADLNRALLRSGTPIGDMNEVRASVSRIKGGRLAAVCRARRSTTFVLSDVVGVGVSHVSSGPSLGAGMGRHAVDVARRFGLDAMVGPTIMDVLASSDPISSEQRPQSTEIGSPGVAARAAVSYFVSRGLRARVVTSEMEGEARMVARDMVRMADPDLFLVQTGETTVTVRGSGRGGRNQEAALSAALEIAGTGVVFGAFGTDGIDGATPAAGAVVDGSTATLARGAGVDLVGSLETNDSYTALSAIDAVLMRGDTGTNVGDLWMVTDVG